MCGLISHTQDGDKGEADPRSDTYGGFHLRQYLQWGFENIRTDLTAGFSFITMNKTVDGMSRSSDTWAQNTSVAFSVTYFVFDSAMNSNWLN